MAQLILNGYIGFDTEITSYLVKNHKNFVDHTETEELWEILAETATKADIHFNEELEDVAIFYIHFMSDDNDSNLVHEGVTRSVIGTSVVGKDNPKYETLRFIAKTGVTATIESINEGIIFINGATKED